MINIKSIKQSIIEGVREAVCEKYGVPKGEVKVTFKSNGEINVTVTPKTFLESIGVKVDISLVEEE